jgi:hypothetical protein
MFLRDEIAIKQQELVKIKKDQQVMFNKRYKINSNVSYYELVKAALFGNGT